MRRLLVFLGLGLALSGLVLGGFWVSRPGRTGGAAVAAPAAPVRPPALVHTAPVVARETPVEFTVMGTVLPARRSVVAAGSPGRITAFHVKDGDFVRAEQPLLQQRTKDLEIELKAAQANLEYRRHDFLELQAGYRPQEIEQARARLAMAEAQKRYASTRVERTIRSGSGARAEELDEGKAMLETAVQNVAQARSNLELAVEGPREEHKAKASAMVDAAAEEVERLKEELWKKTLRAPFDGYLSAQHAEVGQWLDPGNAAVEVIELKTLEVDVKVPERYVALVAEDQPVTVQIEALGAVGPRALEGKIIRVVPQVDTQSRTLPVKVHLANQIDTNNRPWIKAGQLAQVTFRAGQQRLLLVSKDALVLSPDRDPVVYVVVELTETKDGNRVTRTVARAVPVKTGHAFDSLMEVQGALQPGMAVIVRGNERIQPDQEVKVAAHKP
jgi:RND family efflux transporter MFP subunit